MKFLISDNAKASFLDIQDRHKPVVLIDAAPSKIREYYEKTYDGSQFYSGIGGVEKFEKLASVMEWLKNHDFVWAPVIGFMGTDETQLCFMDGRHTCAGLERKGYKCIKVAVPADSAAQLAILLGCVSP